METVKKGEITENLNISEASSEGSSIARIDNFVHAFRKLWWMQMAAHDL